MNAKQIKDLKTVLYKWKTDDSKSQVTEEGSELIFHTPWIAPYSWLHEIFKGLDEENIALMESTLPIPIDTRYKEFLTHINGINLFSNTIKIYGFLNHHVYKQAIKRPFDLFHMNRIRVKGTPEEWFFFGYYQRDGSRLFFNSTDGTEKVYRVKSQELVLLNEWENFDVWLLSEVTRVAALFDQNGKMLVDDPTPPAN